MMTREKFLAEQTAGNLNSRLTYERYVELQKAKVRRAQREVNALPAHTRKAMISYGFIDPQPQAIRPGAKDEKKAA